MMMKQIKTTGEQETQHPCMLHKKFK
jgi:hypothetical protein